MNRFGKVPYEQFKKDMLKLFSITEESIQDCYQNIQLPRRATVGSAGYDFFSPLPFTIEPKTSVTIPTGIRVWLDPRLVLLLYPRSGLGFKYRLQLANTVGVIDSDYVNSDNCGHILAKLTNDSYENKTICLNEVDSFMQGIITPYFLTVDDSATEIRNGGFGSTDKR